MLVDAVELDAVFFAEGDATLASEFGVGAGVGGSFGGGRVFVLLLGEFLALAALCRLERQHHSLYN